LQNAIFGWAIEEAKKCLNRKEVAAVKSVKKEEEEEERI
jgi:hypothetical protein